MTAHAVTAGEAIALDERRRALRALLRNPLIDARTDDRGDLTLVRRHAGWLHDWLGRYPGWRLHVDREHARLRKTPGRLTDATRAERTQSGAPLSRRQYALVCLALAALERADRQTALGRIADDVAALAAGDEALRAAGFEVDMARRDHRRDMVHAVRVLISRGVLVRREGDEQSYVSERGDALYDVVRPVLAAMLNVARGPSLVEASDPDERLRQITDEPAPATDEARNRATRACLMRRLLDDPVVYYDDLSDIERSYLVGQRAMLVRQVEDATGLVAEIRGEGIAFVDLRGDLTDVRLPEEGTSGHVTLLIAEHLCERLREQPDTIVSLAEIHEHVASLIATHRQYWRKDATAAGAEVALAEEALDRLAALRLVERTAGGVRPRPSIARYALGDPRLADDMDNDARGGDAR